MLCLFKRLHIRLFLHKETMNNCSHSSNRLLVPRASRRFPFGSIFCKSNLNAPDIINDNANALSATP